MKDNNKNPKTCQTVVFSVYVIWCYKTNRHYVGVTHRKVEKRIREHKFGKRQFLDKEIQKIGWENFDWWVVEEHVPSNRITEREQYWVAFYDCVHPKGYNRTIGGIKHLKHSETTCEQISKANRGKSSAKKGVPHTDEEKANLSAKMKGENNPMYGKHHTTEAKEKNRQSHLGKHHTPETIASISAAVKGENHPMYGKHHTTEAKEKNRQSHLGKPGMRGEKHPMYGKHHKAETIAKMREKANARDISGKNNPMYGKSPANKGVPHTAETRAKIREKALAQHAAKRAAKAVAEENLAAANSPPTSLSTLLDAVILQ
ncbi:MAG: GIY-YIG nuclease family protein [Selenomonadaceae bacterium]|nr:GIY-YIG nuclease family protein [Selenomonadaceae bacterium]